MDAFTCSAVIPSEYYNSLGHLVKKLYSEKLMVDGKEIQDLYEILDDSWIDDVTKWPRVVFGDLYTKTKGHFMKENLRAYKSLKAYNYFYNGYVRTVWYYSISLSVCLLKALVNPSQKSTDKANLAWVMLSRIGVTVKTGHMHGWVSCVFPIKIV